MAVWATRVAFILVIFGVGWAGITDRGLPLGVYTRLLLGGSLLVGVLVIVADIFAPRKKLSLFAGAFFGLLVGIVLAYALSFVVAPFIDQYVHTEIPGQREGLLRFINLLIGAITCYLAISFVLQTKDDFRFIVPYVEFKKDAKGSRPILLDTSALIDGRIAGVAEAGLFDAQLIVPRFVLNELQQVADSADRLKRGRGRRGLDVVAKLQKMPKLDVIVQEASHLDARTTPVDQLIITLAAELNARVVTTDFNLNKVAQVGGVDVINLNDLANAVKAEALPGEMLRVRVVRAGEEANQGVGFLDDGTMVVVEHGRAHVGEEVDFVVTNTRQTSAGKMIFGRAQDGSGDEPPASPGNKTDAPPRNTGGPGGTDTRRPPAGSGFGGRSPRRNVEPRG